MTIGLERLLAHMKWANRLTIEHLQTLPDEALKAFATNSEWFVGEIMHHIVEAADNYAYRITNVYCEVPGEKIQELESIKDLEFLKVQADAIDTALQECAQLDDIQLEFVNYSGNLVKRWRSTILSQAIHHATEHRAQIASALEAKGFKPVDLDELDLWSFEIANG
ncbi:MAG: DinB family protein [Actinomycetota bacterium]